MKDHQKVLQVENFPGKLIHTGCRCVYISKSELRKVFLSVLRFLGSLSIGRPTVTRKPKMHVCDCGGHQLLDSIVECSYFEGGLVDIVEVG